MTMRPLFRLLIAALVAFGSVILTGPQANADSGEGDYVSGIASAGGVDTRAFLTEKQVIDQPKFPGDDRSSLVQAALASAAPRYEYSSTFACQDTAPGSNPDALCTNALIACTNPADGPGPLTRLWRRTLVQAQPPTPWELVGTTCWPNVAPGSRPTLTMAMILNAFHTTPWSKPTITTQPAGNITLVTLDTFYQVSWSPEGFQPGEVERIDPAVMLGFAVEIRPRLERFTYVFGDGESFGPTTSEGGVYPTGAITHKFQKAGVYPSRVDTTFGADFRVNGGPWAPIPDTVTVPGPATDVTVKTARAVLVNN